MVTSLDVIMVVFVLGGGYLGMTRGSLAEVIALIGVILGIVLAANFYIPVADILMPILSNEDVSLFISFIGLYGVGVLAFFLIYLVVKSNMAGTLIGPVNRGFAAIIGVVKSVIFIAMLMFIIVYVWGAENSFTSGTLFLPHVMPRCRVVLHLLPTEMNEPLNEYLSDLSIVDENGEQ